VGVARTPSKRDGAESEEFSELVSNLYGLDLDEFIPQRDAAVKRLSQEDKRDLSGKVKALRKPSLAAWALNSLVRDEPEQVAALLRVGDDLREAQANLSGDLLRSLSQQRRAVVRALARRAHEVAARRGQRLSPSVQEQVERSLDAALTDVALGSQLQEGRLVNPLEYAGLGSSDVAGTATVASSTKRASASDASVARHEAAQAEKALADAVRRVDAQRRELDAAQLRVAASQQALDAALEAERVAEERLERAESDKQQAAEQAKKAKKRLDAATSPNAPSKG
jgi:hypothetical protein